MSSWTRLPCASWCAISILDGVDAAGGCVFVSNADANWLTRMQAVKYWIGYQFLKNVENAFSHIMCLSGCLTLYRRAAFWRSTMMWRSAPFWAMK